MQTMASIDDIFRALKQQADADRDEIRSLRAQLRSVATEAHIRRQTLEARHKQQRAVEVQSLQARLAAVKEQTADCKSYAAQQLRYYRALQCQSLAKVMFDSFYNGNPWTPFLDFDPVRGLHGLVVVTSQAQVERAEGGLSVVCERMEMTHAMVLVWWPVAEKGREEEVDALRGAAGLPCVLGDMSEGQVVCWVLPT